MSLREPWSEDHTSTSSPTFACLTPRISSIRGPGQNEPRASITIFPSDATAMDTDLTGTA